MRPTSALKAMSPARLLLAGAAAVFAVAAALATLQLVKSDLRAAVYRDRLETLASEFKTLRGAYNDAVRRTAVTELIVDENNALSVRVSNASGRSVTTPTPFNPDREIYVDYAVTDSRLMIRRVFDADTPPSQALVLDEALREIGWDDDGASASGARFGKAIYRDLTVGRWVIAVSGDGSLGIERISTDPNASPEDVVALSTSPQLKDFDEWMATTERDATDISFGEAINALFTP